MEVTFVNFCCFFTSRLVGSIPGPVFFGAVIDQTCLLFTDSCLFYDNYKMSLYMMLIVVLVKLVSHSHVSSHTTTQNKQINEIPYTFLSE
jgi:hypothetical protein